MSELPTEASQDASEFFDVDALSRAAEGAKDGIEPQGEDDSFTPSAVEEPEQVEDVQVKSVESEAEPPPEPQDNRERSRLGREVSSLKRQNQEMAQQLQQMTEMMSFFMNQQGQQGQNPQFQQEEDEYVPTDRRSLEQFVAQVIGKRSQAEVQAQQKYEHGYFSTLQKIETSEVQDDHDEALHNEVVKLITTQGSKFNRRHSDNPMMDASTNYYAAKAHILGQRLSRPKPKENPLKGNPPKAPLGASPAASAVSKQKLVKIGSEAKRAATAFGLGDDDLAKLGFE